MKKLESLRASASRKLLTAFLAVQMAALNFSPAWAGGPLPVPVDDTGITTEGSTMKVGSSRVGGDIDWNSFDIDYGYTVRFMDSAGMTTVNKIGGSDPSQILGALLANGNIYLLNPNGILFGGQSTVNVGGLVASTMDYDPSTRTFSNPGGGNITVASGAAINAGAFAYLVGRSVDVAGTVNAGDTVFAAYGGSSDSTITLESSGGGTITLNLGEGWTAGEDGSITITGDLSTGSSVAYDDGETTIGGVDAATVTLYASREISQAGKWDATAPTEVNLRADGTTGIILGNTANTFGGSVAAAADNGAITLTAVDALTLGSVSAKDALTVTAQSIGQTTEGALSIGGKTTLTADGGSVVLGNNANDFVDAVAAFAENGAVTLTTANNLSLGEVAANGPVKLDGAAVLLDAPVRSTAASVTILSAGDVMSTANGTITAGTDISIGGKGTAIVNVNAETGETSTSYVLPSTQAKAIGLEGDVTAGRDVWAFGESIQLDGNVEAGNLLYLNASAGDVAQGTSGSVTVGGSTVLSASGHDIALGNDGNDFQGAVEASGKNVTLTDKNGIVLGDAWATNLTVTAKDGDITQKAGTVVKATGATALDASGNVWMTSPENDFGGAVTVTAGKGVSVRDQNSLELGGVTATGAVYAQAQDDIDVTGAVTGGGQVLLETTNGAVRVDAPMEATNGFVYVKGHEVETTANGTLKASGTVSVFGSEITLGADVTAGEDLFAQSAGSFTIKADADLKADQSVSLYATNGNLLLEGNAEAGKQLWVGAFGTGSIVQADGSTMKAGEYTSLNAEHGNIMAASESNQFGPDGVQATAPEGTVSLAAADGILFRAVSATQLSAKAVSGDITQDPDKTFRVTGTTALEAPGNIVLTNSVNDFGGAVTATATGGDVKLADKNDLSLGAVTAGGGVDARAGGNLDVTGAVKGDQRVYLEAVNGTARVDAPVESTSQDVRIVARDVESTTNGTITAATDVGIGMGSTTNVTLSGKVTAGNDVLVNGWVNTLDADIEAGLDLNVVGTGAGDITVTTNANLKAGNFLGLTAGYDIGSGPQDGSIIVDGNAEAGDQLQFIAYGTGDVVQASTSTLKSDRVTVLEAHHGNITAESESNEFGPEGVATVAPEGMVSVAATNGIVFRTVDTTQLTAKAVSGDITQRSDKPFAVTGATTLEAPGAITLTNADNEFGGVVTAAAGAAVSLTDANAIELGAVTATDLTVDAKGGTITQASGTAVTAAGTTTLTATDAITLANADNDFGGVVTATGTGVELVDGVDELTVASVAATAGDATITATGGKFTVDGTVDATGDAVLTAGNGTFELASGGSVTAGGENGVAIQSLGTQEINGTVEATAGDVGALATDGAIVVGSTGGVTAAGDAMLMAQNGTLEIGGAVSAGNDADLSGSGGVSITAPVTAGHDVVAASEQMLYVNSAVTGGNDVTLDAQDGTLTVDTEGSVTAGNDVLLGSSGDMEIAGAMSAGNDLLAIAGDNFENTGTGTLTAAAGNVVVAATNNVRLGAAAKAEAGSVGVGTYSGSIETTSDGTIDAGTDVMIATGMDEATAADITLEGTVTAGNDAIASASGEFRNTATVTAGNNAFLGGYDDVSIEAAVDATAGSALIYSPGSRVDIDAAVTAGTHVSVVADSDIALNAPLTAGSDLAVVSSNGSVRVAAGIAATAGEDLVMKAGQDLSLTTATIRGQNVGLEAGGALTDSNANLKADGTMVLIGSGVVRVKGSVDAAALGMVSDGDIVLDDLTATEFAATSTGGSVRVKTQNDLLLGGLGSSGTSVTADLADGEGTVSVDGGAAAGGLDGIRAAQDVVLDGRRVTGSRIQAGREADIDVTALEVNSAQSGGLMDIKAGSVNSGTIASTSGKVLADVDGRMAVNTLRAGGDADVKVGGEFTADTVDVRGTADLEIKGGATVQDLSAGKLEADIGGSATLRKVNVGGNADIKTGGSLTFDQMKASNVKTKTGTLNAGKLEAGTAELDAGGAIHDNGSLLHVGTLTMTARGDIGSAGKPINLDTRSKIEKISGNNVYLVEQASGHNVTVGTIDASGHLSLTAPRIGLPDGLYGFVDGNGKSVNLHAGNGMELDIAGFFGQPGDPIEANVSGTWTLRSGTLHGMSNGDPSTGTSLSMIYMVFGDTEYTDTPVYAGDGPIPGLVIVNGRAVQGHPDLLRKIHSALAFTADTPELKSEQGVFGHPFFLHSNIALTDMAALGLVDYLKFGVGQTLPITTGLANANVKDPSDPEETIGLLRLWGVQSLFNRPAVQRWEDQPTMLPLHLGRIPGAPKDTAAKKQKTEKTDAGKAASAPTAKDEVPAKAKAPAKEKVPAPAKTEAKAPAPEKAPVKAAAKAPEKTQAKGKKQ